MARRRMVETSLAHDKVFNSMTEFAQLVYLKTLPHTDDWGRFDADVSVLHVRIDPFNKSPDSKYEKALAEIAQAKLWIIYETNDGKRIIQPRSV